MLILCFSFLILELCIITKSLGNHWPKSLFSLGNLERAESALYLLDGLKELGLGEPESRPPFPFTLSKVGQMASANYLCIFAKMTCLIHNNMIRHDFIEMAKQRKKVVAVCCDSTNVELKISRIIGTVRGHSITTWTRRGGEWSVQSTREGSHDKV